MSLCIQATDGQDPGEENHLLKGTSFNLILGGFGATGYLGLPYPVVSTEKANGAGHIQEGLALLCGSRVSGLGPRV